MAGCVLLLLYTPGIGKGYMEITTIMVVVFLVVAWPVSIFLANERGWNKGVEDEKWARDLVKELNHCPACPKYHRRVETDSSD